MGSRISNWVIPTIFLDCFRCAREEYRDKLDFVSQEIQEVSRLHCCFQEIEKWAQTLSDTEDLESDDVGNMS